MRLNVAMAISVAEEKVQVSDTAPTIDVNPSNNAGAIVISGKELEALPDDPDELQSDLQALAGPSAGPNGGQMYIDGFTAGQLPPKSSIREIRINQNPFSSEYDRLGYGRIEIFTKPGTDKYHGQFFVDRQRFLFQLTESFCRRRSSLTIRPSSTAISAVRWAKRHLSFSMSNAATSTNWLRLMPRSWTPTVPDSVGGIDSQSAPADQSQPALRLGNQQEQHPYRALSVLSGHRNQQRCRRLQSCVSGVPLHRNRTHGAD